MWIIPKTLSAFVPDTEGLNLALDEQAWMCEQSLMWRSKHSAAPTWQRRLKKGGWITHLSGRILKPSLHESFVEKYTDSLEDIHANHSVQQASDKEKKTQDTYGHTSSSTSGQLDLFGAFGKMSQDTPRWGYGESCPIWKKKVTERRGAYSQRKKLALHTKGNECSSLPTPQASEGKANRHRNNPNAKGSQEWLTTKVMDTWSTPQARDWKGAQGRAYKGEAKDLPAQTEKNWATPQASDHIEGARTAKESNQKCLGRDLNQMNWPTPRAGNPGSRKPGTGGKILAEEAKKNWPTPTTGRADQQLSPSQMKRNSLNLAMTAELEEHAGPPAQEKSNTSGKNHGSPKLNPNWVESLMLGRGMTGWTQLPTEWIVSDF